jgi:hypothetical protein
VRADTGWRNDSILDALAKGGLKQLICV